MWYLVLNHLDSIRPFQIYNWPTPSVEKQIRECLIWINVMNVIKPSRWRLTGYNVQTNDNQSFLDL